ncbi:UDP-N-acetylglucosamine 2-epimerase [Polynucleobacter sp. MWH-UH35A]|uniref:UDP-N-acetylglucosamine 2-epimerase n=1 Tax=Polynucleobacter sp. MWH-UH35A TaxID=1855619 RepID=UPI001BFE3BD3|nr:UDP-N-acetylglucosamine 2-epimerase [Polynucleobacter sp. MWH-UH35A]QWD60448.1 UDP-N-acetylglucosamine 2-epimerase [Polynucleobacter sp. MWH-UH35A]
MKNNFIFYVGTEAELIKILPVCRRLSDNNIKYIILCNGQNFLYDSNVFDEVTHSNAIFLTVGNIKFPSNKFIFRVAWMVVWFLGATYKTNKYIKNLKKEIDNVSIIVHGDTISTFIGSIVAIINSLKLFHIESGLTSNKIFTPFPEELCRRFVTKYATVRFTPSIESFLYAKKLNNKTEVINTCGNTMYDAFTDLAIKPHKSMELYYLLIIHRQESLLSQNFVKSVLEICSSNNDNIKCYFVMHKQTKDFLININIYDELKENKRINLLDRLPFKNFIELFIGAEFIATDGGTNQEESCYIGKPCFLLRKETERVEGLGGNVVIPKKDIVLEFKLFLQNYREFINKPLKYDSSPSDNIVRYLKNCLIK